MAYHAELEALATSLSLVSQTHTTLPAALAAAPAAEVPVIFLHSVPSAAKRLLLRRAALLLYTPANEHFGIVPLEAMAARVPVLAATSGGPTETVVDGETGWLRDTDDGAAWTDVVKRVVMGDVGVEDLRRMGEKGAARVRDGFRRDSLAERLQEIIREMSEGGGRARGQSSRGLVIALGIVVAAVGVLLALVAWAVLTRIVSREPSPV